MQAGEITFLLDSMLGRLGKWLRVMGFDTHYQPVYISGEIDRLHTGGRLLLSRNRTIVKSRRPALLINADQIRGQLYEIKNKGYLPVLKEKWFSRCLLCNILLADVTTEDICEDIPEYVLSDTSGIRHCPQCKRYFWKGSHRKRMLNQIDEWKLFSF